MYQYFIGIDISKNDFSVALNKESEVSYFSNNKEGFKTFYIKCKDKLKNSLVILETTGGYELDLVHYLQKKQVAVHRANTRQVKYFIRSHGVLGKSDAIDAKGLALYGFERHKTLNIYREHPQKKLLKLVQRRNDLIQMLVQEKNRRKAPDQAEFKKSFNTIIEVLEKQIDILEKEMEQVIASDGQMIKQREQLETLNGIGRISAMQLLALLPELGQLNRKQIASLAGLAPHPCESGKKIGYRATKGGRRDVKRVLFMAALTAARSHSKFGSFYQKLVANGKKKMVALTALMRKMLVVANAKVRDLLFSSPLAQHG